MEKKEVGRQSLKNKQRKEEKTKTDKGNETENTNKGQKHEYINKGIQKRKDDKKGKKWNSKERRKNKG